MHFDLSFPIELNFTSKYDNQENIYGKNVPFVAWQLLQIFQTNSNRRQWPIAITRVSGHRLRYKFDFLINKK